MSPQVSLSALWRLAILSLGLYLGLRPAEVGLISLANVHSPADGSLRVRFRRVKARLFQKWDTRLISSAPVSQAVRAYLAVRPSSSSLALFPDLIAPNGPGLPPDRVNALLKAAGAALGIPDLRGGSLRIGCASSLAMLGYPDTEIRGWGSWASDAYLKYVRNARSHTTSHSTSVSTFFPPYLR
ncbi:MAG: hypothetical protein Q8P67_16975 [archaeon]|nr:hypothetical protein [archaeon]